MKALMLILLTVANAHATPVRVAIVDTGYSGNSKHLCATGHFDFTQQKAQVGEDTIGHGTKIVEAIESNAKNSDYCLLIYKVFSEAPAMPLAVLAIEYALRQHADVLNLSFEGPAPSAKESRAIAKALTKKVKVFVAAGNKTVNLDIKCNVFPACYPLPGLEVVGSFPVGAQNKGNYGAIVKHREDFCFDGLCGTSLSTAIATGKYVKNKGRK